MYNKNSLCICVTVERKLKGQDRKQSPETNVQHLQNTSAQLEVKSLLQKDFQFSALLCEGIYHFAARMEPLPFPHLTEL